MKTIYEGGFTCREDVARQFQEGVGPSWDTSQPFKPVAGFPAAGRIVYATYEQEAYEGSATVVFTDTDGKLWEVHGSHCSCYGLEGQWKPEETTWAAIAIRPVGYQCPAKLREIATRRVSRKGK